VSGGRKRKRREAWEEAGMERWQCHVPGTVEKRMVALPAVSLVACSRAVADGHEEVARQAQGQWQERV